ncbi:uncharacterized protein LOC123531408 [Mercenaria mercenaria]|uniref:uncharacterized protein LOC123531408 n=1 Tax=Mercenaria mercenaria TaxID=6596 RepID=UPI00234E53F4|nr:uncharacterized protein LOC123531408 [Mercenaria mercenaria]
MSRENSPRGHIERESRQQVVEELKDYFDNKFESFQSDLKRDSEWTASSAAKKVKRDSFLSFKNISNKKQFEFNSSVLDIVDNIEKAVSYREANKALEFVKEARSAIKHRNKLIRIADSSDSGWATINEYELLEIASDSEDDKRIRRAEERAKKKAEKNSNMLDLSSRSSSFRNNSRFSRVMEGRRSDVGEVVCYRCGQEGHYANVCTVRRGFMGQQPYGAGKQTATVSKPPADETTEVSKQ